ncbi:MAG: CheR family methyltransferase [Bacillota bacterium]
MESNISSQEFLLMKQFIEEHSGIYISEDKSYLIESRLSRLLKDSGYKNFEDFYRMLYSGRNPEIVEKVIDAITTNETLWFRDSAPWTILEEVLLPAFIDALRSGKKSKIRIWSTACSSGQEPYSIAMCIDHYLMMKNITDISLTDFEILASDISKAVLEVAQVGKYDNLSISRGLKDKYKDIYFVSRGQEWIISERIKEIITFRQFNLQRDFSLLGSFDVIFCRYVIIYFSEKLKRAVLEKIAGSLKPDGVLFIGSSELICDYDENFYGEQYKNGIFYKLRGKKIEY